MGNIYVIGHKNPDTDSVCSAIAYSKLKNMQGIEECVPVILGKVNSETKFALEYFDVPVPEMISSVKTQLCDIDFDKTNCIKETCTIKSALEVMNAKYTLLPVVDKENKLIGILSTSDIMEYNIKDFKSESLIGTDTSFRDIVFTLNAKIVGGKDILEEVVTGKVSICTSRSTPEEQKDGVVIISNETYFDTVFNNKPKCIICENNLEPARIPKNFNGMVLSTPYSIFNIIRIINLAEPVKNIMKTENFLCFRDTDYIDSIKEIVSSVRFRYFPVLSEDGKVLGMLSRRHLINNKTKNVILVDHNEKMQAVDGLSQATVLEIVDHHRVGDVQTLSPIFFRNEPYGSTATIIAMLYDETGKEIDQKTAGILLSAILSDTLIFKSPTCTLYDTEMAERLGKLAQVDIYEYGKKLLYNGTDMQFKTVETLVAEDFKEYVYNAYKFAISQVKVIELKQIDDIRDQLMQYIYDLNNNRGYDMIVLMITDILKSGSEFFYVGDLGHVVREVFDIEEGNGTTGFIKGVISRKTQVAPQILNRIAQLKR